MIITMICCADPRSKPCAPSRAFQCTSSSDASAPHTKANAVKTTKCSDISSPFASKWITTVKKFAARKVMRRMRNQPNAGTGAKKKALMAWLEHARSSYAVVQNHLQHHRANSKAMSPGYGALTCPMQAL